MADLKLLEHIRQVLEGDTISVFYHGLFDDEYTDKLITIAAFDSERKVKGRMAFVMAESFQNVIRHKDEKLDDLNNNAFGIRGRKDWVHIFSSNLVDLRTKDYLAAKLQKINAYSQEELKELYMSILSKGQLSEKGGAGLGLIEMARKSDHPLQYEFYEIDEDTFAFNMQVDFIKFKDDAAQQVVQIEKNSVLNELILTDNILFIYNGEFSDDVIQPMIPIVESNAAVEGTLGYSIFHIAVELMQNIGRHGSLNTDGQRTGLFILRKLEDGYYICSGNYTEAPFKEMKEYINQLNEMNEEELNIYYKKALKESVLTEVNSARVGLIDIRRTAKNPIEIKSSQDENGTYFMIGVKISI